MSVKKRRQPLFKDARDTDIIIFIMGITGAGRSTFFNLLLGPDTHYGKRSAVGSSVKPCTERLNPVALPLPREYCKLLGDRRIVIVDTPGFDHPYKSDEKIMEHIVSWLTKSYHQQMHIGGVIHVHDITQDRYHSVAYRQLQRFKRIYGEDSPNKMVIVTSKWGRFHDDGVKMAMEKERELRTLFWKDIPVVRLYPEDRRATNAWEAVCHLLKQVEKAPRQPKKTKYSWSIMARRFRRLARTRNLGLR